MGHREGIAGTRLMAYGEARRLIYLPSYAWVLEHRLRTEVGEIRSLANDRIVVLLDYEAKVDVEDLSRPLSHAALVRGVCVEK